MRVFMIDRSFLCVVAVVTLLCDFAVCVWCVFFFKLVEWQYLSPGRTLSLGPVCVRVSVYLEFGKSVGENALILALYVCHSGTDWRRVECCSNVEQCVM